MSTRFRVATTTLPDVRNLVVINLRYRSPGICRMTRLTNIARENVVSRLASRIGAIVASCTATIHLTVIDLIHRIENRRGVTGAALVGCIRMIVRFTCSGHTIMASTTIP